MNLDEIDLSDAFREDLKFLGISVLIVLFAVAGHNYATPDEPLRVGMVELETNCAGLDAGICLGVERRTHTTYNYDNYTEAEPGTPNYYRRVESELMAKAYSTCDSSMNGYDWTSEVSYEGKTGEEWRQMEEIELLPCEKTLYRNLTPN